MNTQRLINNYVPCTETRPRNWHDDKEPINRPFVRWFDFLHQPPCTIHLYYRIIFGILCTPSFILRPFPASSAPLIQPWTTTSTLNIITPTSSQPSIFFFLGPHQHLLPPSFSHRLPPAPLVSPRIRHHRHLLPPSFSPGPPPASLISSLLRHCTFHTFLLSPHNIPFLPSSSPS